MNIINITDQINRETAGQFPPISESSNVFPVVKRPLQGIGQNGEQLPCPDHVGTYRAVNGKPVCLGVVGNDYKVIGNRKLYHTVQNALLAKLTPSQLDGVKVKDTMSFSGAWTKRTWTLPGCAEVMQSMGQSTSAIALQFGLVNSFDGTTSLRFTAGRVDLVCTNGMIGIVPLSLNKRRHTKGLTEDFVGLAIDQSLESMQEEFRRIQVLNATRLSREDAEALLKPAFSEQRVKQLMQRFMTEGYDRGYTAWALYSALTYYASHNSHEFGVRRTGADNVAKTLDARQDEIAAFIQRPAFQELMAA